MPPSHHCPTPRFAPPPRPSAASRVSNDASGGQIATAQVAQFHHGPTMDESRPRVALTSARAPHASCRRLRVCLTTEARSAKHSEGHTPGDGRRPAGCQHHPLAKNRGAAITGAATDRVRLPDHASDPNPVCARPDRDRRGTARRRAWRLVAGFRRGLRAPARMGRRGRGGAGGACWRPFPRSRAQRPSPSRSAEAMTRCPSEPTTDGTDRASSDSAATGGSEPLRVRCRAENRWLRFAAQRSPPTSASRSPSFHWVTDQMGLPTAAARAWVRA